MRSPATATATTVLVLLASLADARGGPLATSAAVDGPAWTCATRRLVSAVAFGRGLPIGFEGAANCWLSGSSFPVDPARPERALFAVDMDAALSGTDEYSSLAILLMGFSDLGRPEASISQQGKGHEPRFQPGVPILSQVRPDDSVVEVLKDAPPDVAITQNAEEEIEGLTRMSDAVAVGRVVDKRSAFTTQDSPPYRVPGDWIDSTVAARVLTVLKDSFGRLVEGGSVSFPEDGGELVLDDRRIIARNSYELPTRIGRTYLMFFWLNEGARQSLGPSWTFHVDGQKVRRLRTDIHPEWELDTKTLEWAESRVRANAHLPSARTGRLGPAQDVVNRLLSFTGSNPVECGRHLRPGWTNPPTADLPERWLTCVRQAARANRPFFLLIQNMGIDSWVASGFVGAFDGIIRQFSYDSDPMGGGGAPPNFRVRPCSAPAVVINPDGWAAITCDRKQR
jgi:hypothetical protein